MDHDDPSLPRIARGDRPRIDQEVLADCVRQSKPAFRQFVNTFQLIAWRSVARRTGVQEAEDVAQEVFIEAFSSFPRYRLDRPMAGDPVPWLLCIARNKAIDFLRSRKAGIAVRLLYVDAFEVPDSSLSPEACRQAKEELVLVQRRLSKLPQEQAEAYAMFVFEQLTLSEIATATHTNPRTVRSRLRAARDWMEGLTPPPRPHVTPP